MLIASFRTLSLAAILAISTASSTAFAAPFDSLTVAESSTPLSTYQQVYIAPVIMDLDQKETSRNLRLRRQADPYVPAEDQEEKAADLHTALTTALSKHRTIAETPGPNVLTITPKLTRLVPSRLTLASRASTLGLDVNRTVIAGGATFEVTLSEGETVLASLEDKYTNVLGDGVPRVGYWQDADDAFSFFSKKLARYVKKN